MCERKWEFPTEKKEEEAFFLGFLTWVHFSSYSDTYRVFYEEGAGGCSKCPVESFTVLKDITALGIYLKKYNVNRILYY